MKQLGDYKKTREKKLTIAELMTVCVEGKGFTHNNNSAETFLARYN